MRTRTLTDRDEILRFLERDRDYAAYAIGDLEPALFAQSEWAGAEREGRLITLALYFKGLSLPALFLMGEPVGLAAILRFGLRPERALVTCQEPHLPALSAFYHTRPPVSMWRMVLDPGNFRPVHAPYVVPLSPRYTDELADMYARGNADGFSPTQLATGVFYGVLERGRVVAAAGTHLISPTYGLAAVGNVYTEEEFRGRGYGAAVTSAVVAELFQRGIRRVVLNVAQDNTAALHIYEHLGFDRACAFLETIARRKT